MIIVPELGEIQTVDIWTAPARTLTNPSGVFNDATRTLSAFDAAALFDLPIADSLYGEYKPFSSANPNTFGAWVEISADIGVGKRLAGFVIAPDHDTATAWEVEFGEGALGAETPVARGFGAMRVSTVAGIIPQLYIPLWVKLSDNARLSVRVRDQIASALAYFICPQVV